MKKIIICSIIAVASIFGGIQFKNSTVFNPTSKAQINLDQLSYYGQYNSYNNSFRTNYVRPYVTHTGRYVNGYYRS